MTAKEFVWIKAKLNRLELAAYNGDGSEATLRCRDCDRWVHVGRREDPGAVTLAALMQAVKVHEGVCAPVHGRWRRRR